MANTRISQQLSTGYNPDGTPGTITTGVPGPPGPPPSDEQVVAAVTAYIDAHPIALDTGSFVEEVVRIGSGADGSPGSYVAVGSNKTVAGYVMAQGTLPNVPLYLKSQGTAPVIVDSTLAVNGFTDLIGDVSVAGTLLAQGSTVFTGPVLAKGPTVLTGSLTAQGSTVVTGPLTAQGSTVVTGPLTATGNALVQGVLTAANAVVQGTLTTANAVVQGTLTTAGAVVQGTLTTAGAVVQGNLTVRGTLTTSGSLGYDSLTVNGLTATEVSFGNSMFTAEPMGWMLSNGGLAIYPSNNNDGLMVVNPRNAAYQAVYTSGIRTASDRRLKSEIVELDGALAEVRTTPVYRYLMSGERRRGLIADEAPAEIRREDADGLQMLETYDLVSTLWGAVRELADQIEGMEQTCRCPQTR